MALYHHTSYKSSRKRKVYGKISVEVHKPNGILTIKYNALDQKVSQSTSRNDSIVTEYFVYDPSGNVLASYGDTIKIQNFNVISHKFSLHQLTIYGSSRTGLIEVDSLLWKDGSSNIATVSGATVYIQKLGLKRYELSNHLGNVSTVIRDRKLVDSNAGGLITSWKADVISVTDYYAYGMKIEERSWNRLVSGVEPYRFGFNGKDFFSDWNRQDYGFRIYDPRKCRFESVDPLHSKYPELTTYQFASNSPTSGIDLDGKEYYNATYTYRLQKDGTAKLIKTDYVRVTHISNENNLVTVSGTSSRSLSFNQAVPKRLPYGKEGMGVAFTLILHDENGNEVERQTDIQKRQESTDYGVYSGATTIWAYKWENGNFKRDKSDETGYKGEADYNIPPIDPIDHAARIHDKRYDAVEAVGAFGLLSDFATIEADMEASRSWKAYGTPLAKQQAYAFDLIVSSKKSNIFTFMESSGQIKKGYWEPDRKIYIPSCTKEDAYLAFRAKYMLQDQDGNWTRKKDMWTTDNKPKN